MRSRKADFSLKSFFFQWEWMLIGILGIVTIINTALSEYYLDFFLLVSASSTFLDKAFIVLPMVYVMILGDIDISVASTLALSSVIMGVSYNAGLPMYLAMFLCVATATLCGFTNGYLITKFRELSAVIITLSTMIIYRGIAYVILEDQASGKFPDWFGFLGWGSWGMVPFSLVVFLVFAALFYILLHRTTFGRKIYAIGNNKTASLYSGVKVRHIKRIVFTLTGSMTGIAALFLTSRLGSTRPNVAIAYELDVIAIVVLGGISSAGGEGKMTGAIIAIFLVGYLRYGLGLANVPSQVLLVIVGGLLVGAVLIPHMVAVQNRKRLLHTRK